MFVDEDMRLVVDILGRHLRDLDGLLLHDFLNADVIVFERVCAAPPCHKFVHVSHRSYAELPSRIALEQRGPFHIAVPGQHTLSAALAHRPSASPVLYACS